MKEIKLFNREQKMFLLKNWFDERFGDLDKIFNTSDKNYICQFPITLKEDTRGWWRVYWDGVLVTEINCTGYENGKNFVELLKIGE